MIRYVAFVNQGMLGVLSLLVPPMLMRELIDIRLGCTSFRYALVVTLRVVVPSVSKL